MTGGRRHACSIYGVLDLKAGEVVHAVGGQRGAYQPVRSAIAVSAAPRDVADAFVQRLGLGAAYVADLDALAGYPPDLAALATIADAGLDVLVDAGCADAERARALAAFCTSRGPLDGIAVALETLPDMAVLAELVRVIGVERTVLSLDLCAGRPLARCRRLTGCSVEQIAAFSWQAGVRRLLVLDLAAVGSGTGPVTIETCRRLCLQFAWDELTSGGGVRHAADVAALMAAGCHGVLVGTALHTGALGPAELARWPHMPAARATGRHWH